MATAKRRYWGTVTPLPAPALAMQAKMQEDAGLDIIINNAGFTNAALDKQHYLRELRDKFHRPVDLSGPLRRLEDGEAELSEGDEKVKRSLEK